MRLVIYLEQGNELRVKTEKEVVRRKLRGKREITEKGEVRGQGEGRR